jgi:hypothetical protein
MRILKRSIYLVLVKKPMDVLIKINYQLIKCFGFAFTGNYYLLLE